MSFQDREELHYDLLNFSDPNAPNFFGHKINPNGKLNKVYVEFNDTKVRTFYWKNLLKDVETADSNEKLYLGLIRAYKAFHESGVFKNMGVTFQPDESEGTLKVTFTPNYDRKISFRMAESVLGTAFSPSFAVLGGLTVNNLFGMFDNLSFSTSHSYYGNIKHNSSVNYEIPKIYKGYSLGIGFGTQTSCFGQNVVEKGVYQLIHIAKPNTVFTLRHVINYNSIDLLNHSQELLEQELAPYRKISFACQRFFANITGNRPWGWFANISKVKGEIGHVEKAGNFVKLELQNSLNFSPIFLWNRGRLDLITFENHSLYGVISPLLQSKIRLNERFFGNGMRGFADITNPETVYDKALHPSAGNPGFEFLGDYKGDDLFFQNNTKMVFNKCPILTHAGLRPFLYFSYGYFSGEMMSKRLKPSTVSAGASVPQLQAKPYRRLIDEIRKKSRISFGIGIQGNVKKMIKLEALINLFMVGTPADKFKTFELRCSVFD